LQETPREKGTAMKHGSLCIVTASVASGAPVHGVMWNEPVAVADSGFICWAEGDGIDPEREEPPSPDLFVTACVHCVVNSHTEAGVLLDRARRNGIAIAHE
jgi:hypothetical protein